jgi:hypothetical protein
MSSPGRLPTSQPPQSTRATNLDQPALQTLIDSFSSSLIPSIAPHLHCLLPLSSQLLNAVFSLDVQKLGLPVRSSRYQVQLFSRRYSDQGLPKSSVCLVVCSYAIWMFRYQVQLFSRRYSDQGLPKSSVCLVVCSYAIWMFRYQVQLFSRRYSDQGLPKSSVCVVVCSYAIWMFHYIC